MRLSLPDSLVEVVHLLLVTTKGGGSGARTELLGLRSLTAVGVTPQRHVQSCSVEESNTRESLRELSRMPFLECLHGGPFILNSNFRNSEVYGRLSRADDLVCGRCELFAAPPPPRLPTTHCRATVSGWRNTLRVEIQTNKVCFLYVYGLSMNFVDPSYLHPWLRQTLSIGRICYLLRYFSPTCRNILFWARFERKSRKLFFFFFPE